MYSALCPQCGAAIYRQQGGSQLVACHGCPWRGRLAFHYLPNSSGSQSSGSVFGGVGFLSNGMAYPTLAPLLGPDEQPAPDPLEARREAAWTRFCEMGETVNDALRELPATDWQTPAWRRYERLQEAHAALYTALGGVRMGEYPPARARLDEALASVLLWALLTLDAVER